MSGRVMMRLRLVRFFAVVLCSLTLGACGWHLRGTMSGDLTIESAYVSGASNDPELVIRVKDGLTRYGVTMVDEAQAQVRITLGEVSNTRRVLTTDADGNVSEYEVAYALSLTVIDRDGKTLPAGQQIRFTRDYTFDENAMLEKHEEEQLLIREMRADAAREVIRRLQRATQAR